MDSIISKYPFVPFGELNYCVNHGIAYQRDMTTSVDYNDSYFEHYVQCESSEIAKKLNSGRSDITKKYCQSLLDIGIGSGEFIKTSPLKVLGYDINPSGVDWLKSRGIYHDPYENVPEVDGFTFWDALEHIPEPHKILELINPGKFAFISMPIFTDLTLVRESKHYKPNEHYYYFTASGMINWLKEYNFELVELSDLESRSGRERILTFVFKRTH